MVDIDPFAYNVTGVKDLVASPVNKVQGADQSLIEGIVGDEEDVFSLSLTDEELLKLSRKWTASCAPYKAQIKKQQKANYQYYLGRQWEGTQYSTNFPIEGNLIFEAEETFLPAALSRNPDPVVYSNDTPEGQAVSDMIKIMLQYHADYLNIRTLLQRMTRQWTIYHLGVLKIGWDNKINEIKLENRKIQNFIFDPTCSPDPLGHFKGYLGEQIVCTADELIDLYPSHKEYISEMVDGALGTDVQYTEWWTDEYYFVTFKEEVLDKGKNPHFVYETKTEEARNHFPVPKKPYIFLSLFTMGDTPHDITGLIEQNIPNQNLITKRIRQIDKNLSLQNNSVAYSADNFSQETAKQANQAMEDGNGVIVPAGRPISEAIVRFPAEGFPVSAFDELTANKEALRSMFGVEGILAQPEQADVTARGMILNQQFSNSRIGGGIGESLERMAKGIFNWLVQMYHVYYDDKHFAAVLGTLKAVEYAAFSREEITHKVIVTVAPDSMKPHDEITEMNQAITLWNAGALGLKTFLTLQKLPDPHDAAEDTVLWLLDKNSYLQMNFPELWQKINMLQQGQAPQGAPAPQGQGQVTPPQPPESVGGVPASPALSNVPLPQ